MNTDLLGSPAAVERVANGGSSLGELETVDGAEDVFALAVGDFDGAGGGGAGSGDAVFAFVEEREVSGEVLGDGHGFAVSALLGAGAEIHGLVSDAEKELDRWRRAGRRCCREEERRDGSRHGVYP